MWCLILYYDDDNDHNYDNDYVQNFTEKEVSIEEFLGTNSGCLE